MVTIVTTRKRRQITTHTLENVEDKKVLAETYKCMIASHNQVCFLQRLFCVEGYWIYLFKPICEKKSVNFNQIIFFVL